MCIFRGFIYVSALEKKFGKHQEELVDLYMEGRARNTIKQYNGAYKKWVQFVKYESGDCLVDEGLVCKYLSSLEENGASEGSVNQFMAMMSMLNEVQENMPWLNSSIISQIKKAVVKRMNSRKIRKLRLTMTKKHMSVWIQEVFKREERSLEEKRLFTAVACMFFCMKRFSDIIKWKFENMTWNDDGSIVVIQPTSKTDQIGKGIIIKIPCGRKGKIGPAEIIRWYLKSQEIPLEGFLFSVLRASGQGVVSWWKKAVGYDTIRKQFKNKCLELKLPVLDIHSCRIGAASESARLGARREVVKEVGGWKSAAVDLYIRPEEPLSQVVNLLT